MKPYLAGVSAALALLLFGSVFQVAGPLLTKTAVDRYLVKAAHPEPFFLDPLLNHILSDNAKTGLGQLAGLYVVVIVTGLLTTFFQNYLMQWIGQKAMFDLRRDLMAHLQQLDIAFFDRNPVGRLVTRLTGDVDVLNDLFTSGLISIAGDVVLLAAVLLAMLKLSPSLTGLLLLASPAVLATTWLFRRTVAGCFRRIRVAIARINAYLQERVSGIAVVQLFNREDRSRAEFSDINRVHMEAYKDAILAYGWFYPAVEFIGVFAVAGLLGLGGYQIHMHTLTLGVLLAFFQYGLRFFRPIQDLSERYNVLQLAVAAAERVFRLLDTGVEIQAPAHPATLPDGASSIEFDQVWFAYKDEDWVLRDVSFTIAPGETIAVVGHTGAGKTTLVNLLLRFYDVGRGHVRIGGVDLRELDPKEIRRHFGVVLQEPHMFTGTIEDNIRLGTPWIQEAQLAAAVEQVNLTEFIHSLPGGFNHPVRERGSGLSTGQKQLISFARALAHNPSYLILDEATSSVDTETEFRVRQALSRMVAGRTSIIIAHRLSTIQRADRIFVMHKGELRETGTHQQLLRRRGIYWTLYQLQYKDQELPSLVPEPAPEPRS